MYTSVFCHYQDWHKKPDKMSFSSMERIFSLSTHPSVLISVSNFIQRSFISNENKLCMWCKNNVKILVSLDEFLLCSASFFHCFFRCKSFTIQLSAYVMENNGNFRILTLSEHLVFFSTNVCTNNVQMKVQVLFSPCRKVLRIYHWLPHLK